MTWNDLADKIAAMTPDQKATPVVFVESYDDPGAFNVDLYFAGVDGVTNPADDVTVRVEPRMPYLSPK